MRNLLTRGFLSLAVAILMFPVLAFAQAEERALGGVGITVFKDRNFRGTAATYTRDMPNLSGTGLDNNISSVRIGPGESWEVCENTNYGGRCVVVSGEERDLGQNNWDNKISSFRRVGGTGGGTNPPATNPYIVLYDQPNYRGNPRNYDSAAGNLSGNARSVTIGSGAWELCDGYNYSGRCQTVTISQANLANIGLNRERSVRPKDASSPAPGSDWYIVLFSQVNFRGTPANYKTEQPRINRTTRSITIGKGVWEVCSGYNFTGNCETLDASVSNTSTLGGFGRTVRSLRPLMRQPR